MNNYEKIKAANPQIKFYSVCEPEFRKYGRVIDIDISAMSELTKKSIEMPEGVSYVTALKPIDEMPEATLFRQVLCGQMDEQWGCCWGHNSTMEALEWHTCNEFNVGVTDAVLIFAKRADIGEDGRLDSAKAVAFYLPEGTTIEVYSDTLHYAPCEVTKDGFIVIVGLQRGTNEAVDDSIPHDRLVTAANKWLLAHEESALVKDGVFPGIYGENWVINRI